MTPRKRMNSQKSNCYICVFVLALIIGGLFFFNYVTTNPNQNHDSGKDIDYNDDTNTDTTTTTTEPTTTTTSPTRYYAEFKWDFIPLTQVTRPTYIVLTIQYDDPLGAIIETIYATQENIWKIGSVPINYNTEVRVSIAGPQGSGWEDFELNYEPYRTATVGGAQQTYDMTLTQEDWGDCWLKWVVV